MTLIYDVPRTYDMDGKKKQQSHNGDIHFVSKIWRKTIGCVRVAKHLMRICISTKNVKHDDFTYGAVGALREIGVIL